MFIKFMKIFININGIVSTLKVNSTDTIATLKTKIRYDKYIPELNQNLIFSGKYLYDNKTLSDYNITSMSTVYLILNLTGG